MKVIFSHGKESGPWGHKIKTLADIAKDKGFDVDSIDYTDTLDPDIRVDKLKEIVERERTDVVLVGSSMGGYVSLVTAESYDLSGLFLLAPALYIDGYKHQIYKPKCNSIEVIHGWGDDVIPVENSIKFAKSINCSLHLISGDHRLNSSLDAVVASFSSFLDNLVK